MRDEIAVGQQLDFEMLRLIEEIQNSRRLGFNIYDGILRFGSRLYISAVGDLRDRVLAEAHTLAYTVHLEANKMYQDLRMCY